MLTCVLDKATDAIDNRSSIPRRRQRRRLRNASVSPSPSLSDRKRGIKIARLGDKSSWFYYSSSQKRFISKSADFNLRKTIVVITPYDSRVYHRIRDYESQSQSRGNSLSHPTIGFGLVVLLLFSVSLIWRPPSHSSRALFIADSVEAKRRKCKLIWQKRWRKTSPSCSSLSSFPARINQAKSFFCCCCCFDEQNS